MHLSARSLVGRPWGNGASVREPLVTRRLSASWLVRCPRRVHASSPSDPEFEGVAGDEAVQAALEDQLRLQLRSEVIKESIKEDLRSKVEDIKQISEEVRTHGLRTGSAPRIHAMGSCNVMEHARQC